MLRYELEVFFGAIRFFTRFPVPSWVDHSSDMLSRSARYFPLVGVIVGAVAAFVFYLGVLLFPSNIAVLASMVATLIATGAFHEDGFADAVDGFGGGWNKQRVLEIMKDPRIGSYGVVGMTMMLMAKFSILSVLPHAVVIPALIAAHAGSRFSALTLMYALDYVREDEQSRAQPMTKRLSTSDLCVGAAIGVVSMCLLPWWAAALGCGLMVLVTTFAAVYFVRRIGGYTGDCLGAVQQMTELAMYLGVLAVTWNLS